MAALPVPEAAPGLGQRGPGRDGGGWGTPKRQDRCRDRIELRGLRLLGAHGALPEELERLQPFEVDIDLYADLRPAGESDDLGATIDYAQMCEAARSVIGGEHATLLEHLAERVAERIMALAAGRAYAVAVSVRKLRPPVPVELSSAGVRIFRRAPAQAPGPTSTLGPGDI